jgi:hypothetical protein
MAIGYFTDLAEADTLIQNERLDPDPWTDITVNARREAALLQGYNRIYYSKEFLLPTLTEATAAQLVILKKAQAEMAFYLAIHASDEDRRKGLQAQATVEAGVVKEKYAEALLYDTPIPPFVRDLLCGFQAGEEGIHFGITDLCRDEEEAADTDVCDF